MTAGAPIRVALIGYGLAGEFFHGPLIAATPGLQLASVVTSDPARQERARRAHPGVRIVEQVDRLWDDASDHDLVVVATPNRWHVPLGLRAVEAGLGVVVDKPMAPTSDAARQLLDAARRRGVLLSVFHNRRWDGDFLTVRRLLERDDIGAVTRFESRFERWRPTPSRGAWREDGRPDQGGGVLFDLGSHLVDQALVLFGRPTAVYAEVDRRRPGTEVDDDCFIALHHRGGVVSHLWASLTCPLARPRFRVSGERGGYEKDGVDGQEEALRAGARPDRPGWGREERERWGRLVADGGGQPLETEPGQWPEYYRGVVRALREDRPPPVTPEDGLAVVEVLEAARASATTSQVVVWPEGASAG